MTVNTGNNTAATSQIANSIATAAKKKGPNDLDVNDFLTLMTTQLKNQDPMKPLDSTEFVSQLAQFGTVSGIQSMQSNISALADALRSSQTLSGATLIGRDVLAPASSYTLGSAGSMVGALDLTAGTSNIQVAVKDASGQVVRHIQVPQGNGLTTFTWDGTTDAGERAAPGTYDVNVTADNAGTNGTLQPLLAAQVDSVSVDTNGALTLNTATLGPIALNDVRQVF
jgi:flagellar basal-body rod modification protein FlgD